MNSLNSNFNPAQTIDSSISMTGSKNLGSVLVKSLFKFGSYRIGDDLPSLKVHRENYLIDRKHLNSYNAICGFDAEKISPTYLWVLCFPLIMNILLSKKFPLRAMGQVHLRNRVSLHEPVDLHSPNLISASVGASELTHRGLEWNIDLQISQQDRTLWTGQSTFLYRCNTGIERVSQNKTEPPATACSWSVDRDIGRRYASISGDYNPIHLSALSAKLFGFKRAIAHGMWSKARCLAQLGKIVPEAGYSAEVNFRRPVFLPSEVCLGSEQSQDRHKFSLFNLSGSEVYLDGTLY
jgi:hypothetical protein